MTFPVTVNYRPPFRLGVPLKEPESYLCACGKQAYFVVVRMYYREDKKLKCYRSSHGLPHECAKRRRVQP